MQTQMHVECHPVTSTRCRLRQNECLLSRSLTLMIVRSSNAARLSARSMTALFLDQRNTRGHRPRLQGNHSDASASAPGIVVSIKRLLRSSRLMLRPGVISNGLQKTVDGFQVLLPIGVEGFSMCCALHDQNLFQRVWRGVVHPLGQLRWHTAVRASGNEENRNIKLPNDRFDVAIVRVEPHSCGSN